MEPRSYIIERLEKLIADGEIVLRSYREPGNIDAHDRWFTEVKNFLSVNLPDHLKKLHSVAPKYSEQLIEEPRGRAAYNLIQEQLEVVKLARGELSASDLSVTHQKLAEPIRMFFEDTKRQCEIYEKNVFIMTRFKEGNETLRQIDELIRQTLVSRGLIGHRADDRCYPNDRNLWDNVCTYMLGCKYGIAVLEDIIDEEFNPNVALEYGFMCGLGKPTLLLKEKRFHPRADILGTLWEEFDILNPQTSIPKAINRWLNDWS